MTPSRNCPLCGGSTTQKKYADAQLPVWQCVCGAVFLSPFPSAEELKAIYRDTYYETWGLTADNENAPRQMKLLTFSARLKKISRFLKTGKVLDVGCATGYFLEAAKAAGWEPYGVELSEYSSRLAQQKFGARIFNGTLEEAHFADETFDLITMSDLLEHVRDIDAFMHEAVRILKPSGLLMIVTPNVASLSCRMMGAKWSHYKAEHLHYFSPVTIKALLKKSGMPPLLIEPSPKYLNLAYIINQFQTYQHPIFTPLATGADRLFPRSIKQANFPVSCGELLVLARKP
ncbi:MAG: methyltransferase domain-containing protein [Deltaproteobacteria bacterium]|nr:methyltransferase domain-containing protein [Deltaproteobacteria bacterium]